MHLEIRSETVEGVSVLGLAGDVDLGSAPELRAALVPLFESDKPRLLLDLSGVGFMDSTGIGVMVNALNRVREKSGTVGFCGAQPRVHRILQIAGLLRALPLYPNRADAVAAMTAPPESPAKVEAA